jgi:chemotaxis protein methyltransferase CheR
MKKDDQFHDGAFSATLSDRDFRRLADFIEAEYGIKLPSAKKTMLEGRLRKRLQRLGMESFSRYCDHLFSVDGAGEEVIHMIDVVTTNKTDFFREPVHFDYLVQTALPELIASRGIGAEKPLMLWSAGCSTGEEPYTLAVVLAEFADRFPGLGLSFSILATDISTAVLEKARKAVYGEDKVEAIPLSLRKKYLLRSKDRELKLHRIAPELRSFVKLRRLNLVEDDLDIREQMDVVFCRNVIIYFDRETQKRVLQGMCRHLCPGGYLFLGHSETLNGLGVPLVPVAPTVYRKETR